MNYEVWGDRQYRLVKAFIHFFLRVSHSPRPRVLEFRLHTFNFCPYQQE
jgi:hypothetical protein